jgi:Tol biopolymer transport system component
VDVELIRRGWAKKSYDIPVISPDGRRLVFTGAGADGKAHLWFRSLDSVTTYALPGTEGASLPFWSPDSRFVAFWAASTLRKIDVTGGGPVTLCDLTGFNWYDGGTWNRQGVILISVIDPDWAAGLYRLSDKGGAPVPALPFDKSRHEKLQWYPHFLPDGRHFVYLSIERDAGKGSISLGSLDSSQSRSLIATESNVTYASPGYLVYGRPGQETLFAQPFDLKKLQVTGEAIEILDSVAHAPDNPVSLFSTSDDGVLVYASPCWPKYQLAWHGRSGLSEHSVGDPVMFAHLALSPDEKHVAMSCPTPPLGNNDIWILDLLSGVFSRVTTHPDGDAVPVWSPDGHELIFSSMRTGELRLFRKIVGGGDEEVLLNSASDEFARKTARQVAWQWRPDGSILFSSSAGSDSAAFYLWPKAQGRKPTLLLKTEFAKVSPRVSQDGKWVAYQSNASGRMEIYLARFPSFMDKRQVSNDGGSNPRWRQDGKELFYLSSDSKIMSVPVISNGELETQAPKILFQTPMLQGEYCVTGDGKRFLIGEPVEQAAKPLTVVHNWVADLKY